MRGLALIPCLSLSACLVSPGPDYVPPQIETPAAFSQPL